MTPTQIAAIKGMLAYFDSGNNIPVDKAVIKGNCAEVAALRAALAETAPVQELVAWLPMDTAPKDGTHVFLQVEFEDHAMEDGPAPQQTIGSNTSENDGGPDEWQFAGWDWVHDCYTQGVGTPVSWLPKTALLALVQQPAPPADVPMLTAGELNLARQWFGCIQDINGGWLDTEDFKLAIRLYEMCGMRVPDSVRQKAGLP